MYKKLVKSLILILSLFLFLGCQSEAKKEQKFNFNDSVIMVSDLEALDGFETTVIEKTQVAENEVNVTAISLVDFLDKQEVEIDTINELVLVANDGYEVVLDDTFSLEDIILVYQVDGEELDETKAPLWVVVENQPAKYWVKNLATIKTN